MFVTGLEFLPINGDGPPISSDSEAAVLSISVDNKVCIHNLKYRRKFPNKKINKNEKNKIFFFFRYNSCLVGNTIYYFCAVS